MTSPAALAPGAGDAGQAIPRPALARCGDRYGPTPPDTEHDGWVCAEPAGHLPGRDHRAADGTTW